MGLRPPVQQLHLKDEATGAVGGWGGGSKSLKQTNSSNLTAFQPYLSAPPAVRYLRKRHAADPLPLDSLCLPSF